MNGESKVIPFEKLQSRLNIRRSPNSLFALARSIYMQGVTERLARFFALVDDELFRLSEQADNNALQSHYFNTMRYFRCHRESVQEHYLNGLTNVYESFWRKLPMPNFGQAHAPRVIVDLTLLEDEALEESLAIDGMIEKGGNLFRKELFALDKGFMVMLDKPGHLIDVNPVSPLVLCRLFALALDGLLLDIKTKLLVYKLFDKEVLSSFGGVYHQLNAQMARAGIRPPLPGNKLARRQRMEDANRAKSCNPLGSNPDISKFGLAAIDSLRFQKIGILTGQEMKRLVSENGVDFQGNLPGRFSDRQLESVIDMVGVIFVCILEDPHLSDSIKAILASLQIPVLKIALFDKTFCAKKNHPVRMLLNSLAQAGVGVETGLEAESLVHRKIRVIVERILKASGSEPCLYYGLLEDFNTFMAIEYRRNRAAEERTRQFTEGKEYIRQAKKAVAHELATRLNGVKVPQQLKSFICNPWKDVMVLAWLRRNKEPDDWNSLIGLIDQLIGTVDSSRGKKTARLDGSKTSLVLEMMKERLEDISYYEEQWLLELVNGLNNWSEESVGGFRTPIAPPTSAGFQEVLCVKDPEFALLIREFECSLRKNRGRLDALPDSTAEVNVAGDAFCARVTGDEDEFLRNAASLGVGQWIEFDEGLCEALRAKLSWKSRRSGVYVFVNAQGAKVAELKMAELACCFRSGKARIMEPPSAPLIDRALFKLLQLLQTPPAPCRSS